MSYNIKHYNGTTLANIADGTLDVTSTSLRLAGRNFAGYGPYLNENQVALLENFAGSTAPSYPNTGQLWYNSEKDYISVYNGSAYSVLANTAMLSANVSALDARIAANVSALNTTINNNVAALNANAAAQDTQISNLWANAASQATNITNLWANAGVQADSITALTANAGVQSDAIDLRANIASPTLTGNPRSTTASSGDRSTTIATTAYVMAQDDLRRVYTDTNLLANITALSDSATAGLALKANIHSQELTGTPLTPTASVGNRTSQIANTEYVMAQDDIRRLYIDTQIASNVSTLNTAVNNNFALKAPIESPTFTGTARAVTPSSGDNSTKIATTAFVQGEVASSALWQGSHRFISASTPNSGQGVDGDFWFQYQ
jgi:hypothetical protein